MLDATAALNESVSVEEFVQGVADVINCILSSVGSVSDKIAAFENWRLQPVPDTSVPKAASNWLAP